MLTHPALNEQSFEKSGAGVHLTPMTSPKSGVPFNSTTFATQLRTTWIPKYRTWLQIIGLYTIALLIAVSNYLMFSYLDGRAVDTVLLPQSYIGAVSVAFSFLFKACLVTCLWCAFTQWMWRLLREHETKVSTIEDLTRMLFDVTALMNWDAILFQPLLYLCAVLSWSVAIGTIFPPGALVARSQPFLQQRVMTIPVYDPTYRADGTMRGIQENALFETNEIGRYIVPSPITSRIAKRALLSQEPLSTPSPCGQNCSYSLQIPGPFYSCRPGLRQKTSLPVLNDYIYIGNQTILDDAFSFEATWLPMSRVNASAASYIKSAPQNITCDLWESIYTLEVSFQRGIQNVSSVVEAVRPLPATPLNDWELFYPYAIRYSNGSLNETYLESANRDGIAASQARRLALLEALSRGGQIYSPESQAFRWNDSIVLPPGIQNISTALKLSNIRAIHDATSRALSGGGSALSQLELGDLELVLNHNIGCSFKITTRDTESNCTPRTGDLPASMILESSMAKFSASDLTAINLTITAEALNELLRNTTISLLTMPNTKRTLLVTTMNDQDVYLFVRPLNLILPYAITLGISAVFVAFGLMSLHANGASVVTGGFLQILCTTRGSEQLEKLATEASHQGAHREKLKTLENLKIRLGPLKELSLDGNGDPEMPVIGFGTAEELR